MWTAWPKQLPFANDLRTGSASAAARRAAATILIADESALARSYLRLKLKLRGYRVLSARDGARALRLAQKMHPQLVITGLIFPDTTGAELLRALREVNARLPVIVLTMRLEEGAMVEALGLGAVDYITKPFRVGELLARVDRLLQEPYQRTEPSPGAVVQTAA